MSSNPTGASPVSPPRNPHGVQLLPRALRPAVFPPGSCDLIPGPDAGALKIAQSHLQAHGLSPEAASVLPEPNIPTLPPLVGNNLAEHFWRIGAASAQPWLGMAHILADSSLPNPKTFPSGLKGDYSVPHYNHSTESSRPEWVKQPGWTRYEVQRDSHGKIAHLSPGTPVPYPPAEDGPLVFDIETLAAASFPAVLAVAASEKAMYSWLSPWLFELDRPDVGPERPYSQEERNDAMRLIPLGAEQKEAPRKDQLPGAPRRQVARLIVGHNVGYDRARVRDEYTLAPTSTRWLDTMSLHAATAGIASPQRQTWKHITKRRNAKKEAAAKANVNSESNAALDQEDLNGLSFPNFRQEDVDFAESNDAVDYTSVEAMESSLDATLDTDFLERFASRNWIDVASSNSLAEVARLHCNINVPKETRNVFMEADNKSIIVDQLDKLLTYCATDVWVTHEVFRKVWPAFSRDACPHPATMAGVFQLGSTHLPVDREWDDYLRRSEGYYTRARTALDDELSSLAERTRAVYTHGVTSEQAQSWANEHQACLDNALEEMKRRNREPDSGHRSMTSESFEDQARPPWSGDPWLSQLDWSPKKPRLSKPSSKRKMDQWWRTHVPRWYRDLVLKAESTDSVGISDGRAGTVTSLSNSAAIALIQPSWDGRAIHRLSSRVDPVRLWRFVPPPGSRKDELGEPVPELKGVSGILTAKMAKRAGERLTALEPSGLGDKALNTLRQLNIPLTKMYVSQLAEQVVRPFLQPPATSKAADLSGPSLDSLPSPLANLDWTLVPRFTPVPQPAVKVEQEVLGKERSASQDPVEAEWWPKWYWDLAKEGGKAKVSMRNRSAPLLMSMTWHGMPLCYSRQHGWIFRLSHDPAHSETNNKSEERDPNANANADSNEKEVTNAETAITARVSPLLFTSSADVRFLIDQEESGAEYFKVPHEDGANANVGTPFGKAFVKAFERGVLASANAPSTAKAALDLNAFCSYWISARQRILNQTVIWDGHDGVQLTSSGSPTKPQQPIHTQLEAPGGFSSGQVGLILPQVIQMGTVTRRAIEQTWLTASNAKEKRVGSELKAMVKSPPGWSIVGADVDSEELWICSVLGDAQFGHHGSTAIGWMTLEGTKALGTDLHSKTASILGTSRNEAKVFNYSRIYGAGVKHATQLLLKADPSMDAGHATHKAKELYKQTKGRRTPGNKFFNKCFWHGGSESFVFNKLESIAVLDEPRTPVLGCGVTTALSRAYLPTKTHADGTVQEAYLPSRVNWVVQSSGVDYLHLLLTSMDHLCRTYGIQARFLLSFHDDVRYLVKDEDAPRAALALQVANFWTRSMFAYMLEMDDLPLGCAFFSQVDVDKILRKEPTDPCVTPSHPDAVPHGSSLTIEQTIEATGAAGLGRPILPPSGVSSLSSKEEGVQSPFAENSYAPFTASPNRLSLMAPSYPAFNLSRPRHRSEGIRGRSFLYAQSTSKRNEIAALDRKIKALDAASHKAQLDLDAQEGWNELADVVSRASSPKVKKSQISNSSASVTKARSMKNSEPKPKEESKAGMQAENTDTVADTVSPSEPESVDTNVGKDCRWPGSAPTYDVDHHLSPHSPRSSRRPAFAASMWPNTQGRCFHTSSRSQSKSGPVSSPERGGLGPRKTHSKKESLHQAVVKKPVAPIATTDDLSGLTRNLIPKRQGGLAVPFFRRHEHKKNVNLLYRHLLRLTRRPLPESAVNANDYAQLAPWVSEWARHHRKNTSPGVVASQMERAMNVCTRLLCFIPA